MSSAPATRQRWRRPVRTPEDAEFILKNTENCHGFYGASSIERLPAEVALTEQTRTFKRISGRKQPGATPSGARG